MDWRRASRRKKNWCQHSNSLYAETSFCWSLLKTPWLFFSTGNITEGLFSCFVTARWSCLKGKSQGVVFRDGNDKQTRPTAVSWGRGFAPYQVMWINRNAHIPVTAVTEQALSCWEFPYTCESLHVSLTMNFIIIQTHAPISGLHVGLCMHPYVLVSMFVNNYHKPLRALSALSAAVTKCWKGF